MVTSSGSPTSKDRWLASLPSAGLRGPPPRPGARAPRPRSFARPRPRAGTAGLLPRNGARRAVRDDGRRPHGRRHDRRAGGDRGRLGRRRRDRRDGRRGARAGCRPADVRRNGSARRVRQRGSVHRLVDRYASRPPCAPVPDGRLQPPPHASISARPAGCSWPATGSAGRPSRSRRSRSPTSSASPGPRFRRSAPGSPARVPRSSAAARSTSSIPGGSKPPAASACSPTERHLTRPWRPWSPTCIARLTHRTTLGLIRPEIRRAR